MVHKKANQFVVKSFATVFFLVDKVKTRLQEDKIMATKWFIFKKLIISVVCVCVCAHAQVSGH